jgi:hypothetical protein
MTDKDPNVKVMPMTLLPPKKGACQECGSEHPPEFPHNPESLYWHTKRRLKGEEPPTWNDALAHCAPEIREAWVAALRERGIDIR